MNSHYWSNTVRLIIHAQGIETAISYPSQEAADAGRAFYEGKGYVVRQIGNSK